MTEDFGEPLPRLRAVPVHENGEPLADPRELSRRIHFAEKHPKFPDMQRVPLVRRRVAEMLAEAADALPPGIDLMIIEGFRPMKQQRFMYESLKKEMAGEHPEWDASDLKHHLDDLSAPPDDPSPPPHTTGAAVDLALWDVAKGDYVDTVSPYEWDEKSAPTTIRGLSEQAERNRRLLVQTLEATGLTNYAGEWWHWSYGDQGWALRTGAPAALYDRLPEGAES
jgi:D-alanyl-D-alanine dipeptidase